jgi:hypothetical protein
LEHPTFYMTSNQDALVPAPLKIFCQAIITELEAACIHTNDIGRLTMLVAAMTSWCSKNGKFAVFTLLPNLRNILALPLPPADRGIHTPSEL